MSIDIRFSLDDTRPDVQRALNVLYALEQQGYDVDDVMTRALLALSDGRVPADQSSTLIANVKDIIRQLRELLVEMRTLGVIGAASPAEQRAGAALDADTSPQETVQLSHEFLSAVRKAARPGLRLES